VRTGRDVADDRVPDACAPRGTWAVIAGGGTAGHVIPAISIGRALVERGHPPSSVHFVGSRRGVEGRLVREAGFAITLLPGRGVARHLTVDNLAAVGGLTAATVEAAGIMARRRPSVVISVGGYASLPSVIAAIVRPEVLAVDRDEPSSRVVARRELGLPLDGIVLAAIGGSLGARRINDTIVGLAAAWAGRAGMAIRHVVGGRDWEAIAGARPDSVPGGLLYQQVRFEDRMQLVYAAADLMVCRAGASTVAELAAVGMPAVLVPLPGAPGDHQTANARALVDARGATMIPDEQLGPDRLAAELDTLLADRAHLAAMGSMARLLARPDAAVAVAALAERHARGCRSGRDG